MENSSSLLSREEVESEFGIPKRWLELAAHKGEGPPYVKLSRRMVLYRRSDIIAFLEARTVDPAAAREG